jgi:hypothetical protein
MRRYHIPFLTAVFAIAFVTLPTTAAATKRDEALKACEGRGSECKSMGLGNDPWNDVLICVDNRSSGQGVQCVRCQGGNDCTVLREMPTGNKHPLSEVDAVLTESMQSDDSGALQERIRTLEDRVKSLESRK